jgi:hypothetical protein
MAQGHLGRTLMSCDDGQTWIRDRSDENSLRCWEGANQIECDHTSNAARGLEYFNGHFYANFGWGFSGSLRKSADGIQWSTVRTGGWGAGVGGVLNQLVLLWQDNWHITADEGRTWRTQANSFGITFPHMSRLNNKLLVSGRSGIPVISNDGGNNWMPMQNFNTAWMNGTERRSDGGFAEGNGVIVAASEQSGSGRSTNGGISWSASNLQGATNLIFNGTEFVAWYSGRVYKSTDGLNWSSQTSNFVNGPIAYNPNSGVYVLISDSWGNYYERQRAYRSNDGVNWSQARTFNGGHPVFFMKHGTLPSGACP